MRALYEIDRDIEELLNDAELTEDGEWILDVDALQALHMERDQKLTGVALYVKNIAAEAEMVKAEKKALADRQSALERKAERLKEYLKNALNGESLTDPRVKVSFRKAPASVEVFSTVQLPSNYFRVKTEPDKTAIKEALKAGKEVPGARLITDGITMTIK